MTWHCAKGDRARRVSGARDTSPLILQPTLRPGAPVPYPWNHGAPGASDSSCNAPLTARCPPCPLVVSNCDGFANNAVLPVSATELGCSFVSWCPSNYILPRLPQIPKERLCAAGITYKKEKQERKEEKERKKEKV